MPPRVAHEGAEEREVCDAAPGFVTRLPRLEVMGILVLSHSGLGKCVSFVAFVGFSFKLGFFKRRAIFKLLSK